MKYATKFTVRRESLDISIPQHNSPGNRLAEMLLKSVVSKFQCFFGAVAPKIAVHRTVLFTTRPQQTTHGKNLMLN